MPAPRRLIEQLADEHADHLRWLRRRTRGRLDGHAAEDALQTAYARALQRLEGAGADAAPEFATSEKARAWLRTIAANAALDEERRRRARAGLDSTAAAGALRAGSDGDAGVDVEGEVLGFVQRELDRRAIERALTSLAPEHRQILKLRYADSLDPAAIMVLENIGRRQWDGRHSRALKALARALSRLDLSAECRRTRRILRRSPEAILGAGGRRPGAGAHVRSCLACGAFARATTSSLAALPLPVAIEPWRWDLLECLRPASTPAAPRARREAGPEGAVNGAAAGELGGIGAAAGKLAAIAAVTVVAVAGAVVAGAGYGRGAVEPVDAPPLGKPARADATGARWADHRPATEAVSALVAEAAR